MKWMLAMAVLLPPTLAVADFVDFSYPYDDGHGEQSKQELRDPCIIREADTYYLVFTHFPFTHHTSRDPAKPDRNSSPGIRLYSSKDLKAWRFEDWLVRSAELPEDCPYKHRFWAPEIHRLGGRFFLVFTADNWVKDEANPLGRIGAYAAFVGVADRITGPYRHITRLEGAGCDTSLFGDDDGKTYAVMPFRDIFLQEVDLSGIDEGRIRLTGTRRLIVACSKGGAGGGAEPEYLEGPWLAKHEGKYVLFTAAPYRLPAGGHAPTSSGRDAGYWTGTAVADRIEGPYHGEPKAFLGGHASAFTRPDASWWLAYRGESDGPGRGRLGLVPFSFDERGLPRFPRRDDSRPTPPSP